MKSEDIIHNMYTEDAFSQWLGIEILNIGKGTCQLAMNIRSEMLNGFKIAHGGITYALADSALAFASNTHGKKSVSLDTSIHHIEVLKEGDTIVATARETSLKRTFGLYTIDILRETTLVALFKGTVYRTAKEW